MNEYDLGKYFIKNGDIYECIAYTDHPTVELKNMKTGVVKSVVVDSMVAQEYSKLCHVPVNDGYDLDLVDEVERIEDKEIEQIDVESFLKSPIYIEVNELYLKTRELIDEINKLKKVK